ncbi:SGNH/GDSL hydrolase family protein [Anaerocolumna sedimenticola]|uniref:SGNH/GDSL hydrolase family protein n=1 Tax=Anaerocolumna sedimenticola TaxID=2696063 RepID=A0A6P1TJ81_9FIRM|nr:SGNH/GDSL hydrolase family protein [Anaerocolumna sedimenticola]QHQ60142.1 SGNH/GDSL hydrolase family protein [Anaerocolumna sedimenticola]
MKKNLRFNLIVISFFIIFLILLQRLFMPKYVSEIHEGNLIEEYYAEEKNHDVIFVGDCEVFSNISPITLWEDYGITSYIRGSAQQLIWQSYYLLEETLKYEKPKVVVFNVLAMKYNEPQNEAYNRMTLDGMKFSITKLKDIQASKTKEESFLSYLFPILRYHTRWSDLTMDDFRYLFHRKKVSSNGYLMRVDVKPVTFIPPGKKLSNYQFGVNSYDYLNRMTDLCKKNGIQLVLIKSPSVYPYWYEEWDRQMKDYATKNDLLYINFLNFIDEMGIDFTTDTCDGGLHLNLSGAEKFTKYFGSILSNTYQIEDKRKDPKLSAAWKEKADFYYATKKAQQEELKKYGYLKSLGAQAVTRESE